MADVDPRFDPLFQRGYDPARHKTKVSPPRVEKRRETPRPDAAHPEAPRPEPSAPAVLDPEATADDVEPPRRNPFRLILLLTSIAAIGGAGLVLWKRLEADPYGGYGGYGGDAFKIFLDQLADALLTPLLTGGLLGLCLWLALGALRRRRDG